MASAVRKALNIALVQMKVTANKATNLQVAREKVLAAGQNGADVVVLPECFNSPYGVQHFEQYAEPIEGTAPGESIRALSAMAKDAQVYLVGGTIPEVVVKEGGADSPSQPQRQLYNTCPIFNRAGHLLATHRKVHLFDIDVPGKMTFRESSVLHAGNHLTQFTTEWGPIGVGICYDLRFPEMAMIAARRGCIAMIYPAAFNITTGPVFFELLQRARAVDNLFFVATCSPARADPEAIRNEGVYPAWGHSSVVGPVGEVIATCDHEDTTVVAQLDLDRLDEARRFYPIYQQRRFDLYPDVAQGL